jgi:hypothetical protein
MRLDVRLLLFERAWISIKIIVFICEIDLASPYFFILILNIWQWDVDRCTSGRGKRSRSVQEDHGSMDIQHQVPLHHLIYLRVIDVCHGGRWKPQDADPETQLKTTPRSGEVPVRTLPRRVVLSLWLTRPEHLCTIAPTDIPPSGDKTRPMSGCPMIEWSRILIQTLTLCNSRLLWSQFSSWHLKALPL